MNFIKRTTAPAINDACYYGNKNTMVNYGYGLPNCTTYVHGRFAELGANESKLCLKDAKYYYNNTQDGFKRSATPKVGAIACYNGGTYGHVAIVEEIYDNGTMLISESDYVQKITFRTRVVGQKENVYGYALQGFILCPVEFEEEKKEEVVKSNGEVANEVIAGKWGNGNDRVQALSNAGYDPKTIQDIVNQKMGLQNKKSVDEIANEVIRGEWGNGDERYQRLTNAGYDYNEVQAKVNQLL